MPKTLKLFVASAALTAALGLPAWSGMAVNSAGEVFKPLSAVLDDGSGAAQLILIDDEEDDDDDDDSPRKKRQAASDDDDDDDGEDDDDDDDDCDDDEGGCKNAKSPAPAGTVAPPQNGLFSNGTAPKVEVK